MPVVACSLDLNKNGFTTKAPTTSRARASSDLVMFYMEWKLFSRQNTLTQARRNISRHYDLIIRHNTPCLSGELTIQYHQLLQQKLRMSLNGFKGREEFGSIVHTRNMGKSQPDLLEKLKSH
ncbi:hypothetical protein V6N13_130195 [Hibiscus sabdariffa]